jgi:hypothetical protein
MLMVIADRQVLDSGARAPEGLSQTQDISERRSDMFDPAVMGTLLIGLDADQAETQTIRRRRSVAAPRREHAIRLALARGLRRAAALLEPRTVGEVAN